jgi:hypothetical protein
MTNQNILSETGIIYNYPDYSQVNRLIAPGTIAMKLHFGLPCFWITLYITADATNISMIITIGVYNPLCFQCDVYSSLPFYNLTPLDPEALRPPQSLVELKERHRKMIASNHQLTQRPAAQVAFRKVRTIIKMDAQTARAKIQTKSTQRL